MDKMFNTNRLKSKAGKFQRPAISQPINPKSVFSILASLT
jgi:hypothetical protein